MEKSVKKLNYFLEPGNVFVCWQPYKLATVVGSSVAICMFDQLSKVSGMTVFSFPNSTYKNEIPYSGAHSIPQLLEMMYNLGARNHNIQAHVLGGSFSKLYQNKDIGKKNIEMAFKSLKKNRIQIINDDTGGIFGRKIVFDTACGDIVVYKAKYIREKDWYDY